MADQVDPTLPQSAFPYPEGSAQTGAPYDVVTASGPVTRKFGRVYLKSGSVLAISIAAPKAGTSKDGGDDNSVIEFIDIGGAAHTITGPANSINGNKHIATGAGNKGDSIRLRAYGGVWYTDSSLAGFALS